MSKALTLAGVVLALVCLLSIETIHASGGNIAAHTGTYGRFWLGFIAIAWGCAIIGLLLLFALSRQLFFDKRNAIWIEDGNLIYLDKRWMCIRCDAIKGISKGTYGRFSQTIVQLMLRDGKMRSLPTGAIAETPDEIIGALEEAVHHSATGNR